MVGRGGGAGGWLLGQALRSAAIIAAVCGLALAPLADAPAAGNLLKRAERLEALELNAGTGFSIKAYDLETGVYYRWRIVSDGREEYRLMAPELFRNSWIDRVSIEDREVRPMGLHAVEFDDEGGLEESGNYLVDNSRLRDEFEIEYPPFPSRVLEIINDVRRDEGLPLVG